MEHESFEDEATAALLNRHFISVKVDREERPDIDAIYMKAVQAMTEHGGWPVSVFLTPEGEPFYGGTYFPDTSRHGLPSFTQVLERIAELWDTQRDQLIEAGTRLSAALARGGRPQDAAPLTTKDTSVLDAAIRGLRRTVDSRHGGWGGAPKFPQPAIIEFVLRRHLATGDASLLEMVTSGLDAMARGGIFDQLGGGFHRYAVDDIWLVPHFEKMLYDNAQLSRVYLHAWQVTGRPLYRRIVEQTLDYVAREMLDPSGGFYSAQDADSEGEEGRYFLWTPDEIVTAIGSSATDSADDADLFMAAYGVTRHGNFEGRNILHLAKSVEQLARESGATPTAIEARIGRGREALLNARSGRVRPNTDDKVLTGWNGLMLSAFAEAARVLDRADYAQIAEHNAGFVLSQLRGTDGRLLRTWKGGRAKIDGYLEDSAFYAEGLLELYQTTFDPLWFDAAVGFADSILAHFADPAAGFFDTSDTHEALLFRPKETQDGAIPSGGSVAAMVLVKLGEFTGEARYVDAAETALASMADEMSQAPMGFASWLSALDLVLSPPRELAIVGSDLLPMLRVVRAAYRPNLIVAAQGQRERSGVPLLRDRDAVNGATTAYVCRQYACELPVTSPEDLSALLDACVS
jgi:uncharacterized protein YyaL (SSP411 family)